MVIEKTHQTLFFNLLLVKNDQVAALITINIIIMLSNIISSLFLCSAIWNLNLMKTTVSFRFIFALAVSDLSIGLLLQPALIGLLLSNDSYQLTAADFVVQIFTFTFAHFSNGMILIIAADRFLHMRHLQNYVTKMNNRRCFQLIAGNATINLAITVISLAASFGEFLHSLNLLLAIIDFSIMTTIFILYAKSYFSVRNRMANLELRRGVCRRNSTVRSDFELCKGMLFILGSILLCYFPFNILEILVDYSLHTKNAGKMEDELVTAHFWALLLVLCFPSCNAILFAVLNKKIRRYGASFISKISKAKSNRIMDTRESLERRVPTTSSNFK